MRKVTYVVVGAGNVFTLLRIVAMLNTGLYYIFFSRMWRIACIFSAYCIFILVVVVLWSALSSKPVVCCSFDMVSAVARYT